MSQDDEALGETMQEGASQAPPRSVGEATTEWVGDPQTTLLPTRRSPSHNEALLALRSLPRLADQLLARGEPIGEGGMGLVREGVQRSVGRAVAVKSLREALRSPELELQLLREAWLTAALEHPNVVPVHDVLLDDAEGPLIVLKRVDGVTWDQIIDDEAAARERLGEGELLDLNIGILMQLCRATHFAHSHGVIHRDIKPSNVMIGSFGEVYLLDWGIAVSLTGDHDGRFPALSESSGRAGTPCYMAPEMLDPERRPISERTDVYLLGAVLYRIAMGEAPHDGEDTAAMITSIERSRPRFDARVPSELEAIIARAMAPDPADRHPSAEALRLDLQRFLRNRAAMRLCDDALERIAELERVLAAPEPSRTRLYELFGESRFGLQQALRGDPDSARARAALSGLLERMVSYLLEVGDAGAAAALLNDHPDPPPALREAVAAAEAERERERQELERLQRDVDPGIGRAARRAAVVAMGIVWTFAPLLANVVDPTSVPRLVNFVSPVVLLLLALAVWYRARSALNITAINRRFLIAMLVGFCAHMVHVLVTQLMELPPRSELAMGMVSFGAIVAVLAYTAERRLWPLVPVYWLGALAGAAFRDHSAYVLSGCNLLLTAYMFAIWSPASSLPLSSRGAAAPASRRR